MAIHPLLQLPLSHITLQHTYKDVDTRQPVSRYSGSQMELIWARDLRWGWEVVWHPHVKQLTSIKDEERMSRAEYLMLASRVPNQRTLPPPPPPSKISISFRVSDHEIVPPPFHFIVQPMSKF